MPDRVGHRCQFRIYYEDTDAGGIMYHAQYLAFAERGRSEALRDAGASAASLAAERGIVFVVRRVSIDYLRPLRHDDLVWVTTTMTERRQASVRLRQTIDLGDTTHAVLDVTLASVRLSDGRPVRLPEPWAGLMSRLEGEAGVAVRDEAGGPAPGSR